MIGKHLLISVTLLLAALAASCEKSEPEPREPTSRAAASAPAPAQNPVQQEMRVLHEATRDWVTAIANNQLSTIPASIPRIHEAREATEAALEKGSYRPPKNGDKLEAFKKQDETFHDSLVDLLEASKANDLPAATKQLGVVLEGCTSCHVQYRF
jgi:cytochrome c556